MKRPTAIEGAWLFKVGRTLMRATSSSRWRRPAIQTVAARPAATLGYRIMIPVSVERVRVIVAGRTLFDSPPRRAGIALSSGRPE